MSLSKKYVHFIFWSIAIVIWVFWVQERINIFELYKDNFKNIGYLVDTNDKQVGWYLLLSVTKTSLIIVILYGIIPKYGFKKLAMYKTLLWLSVLIILEWCIAKILYVYLLNQNFLNYRLEWTYDFYRNTLIFIFLAILSWIITAAYNWFSNYNELKKLYQQQKSYIQLKEQLNPHFIFNTLNSFYDLSLQENSEKLQEGILDLTDTLRYTIDYSNKIQVNLQKEINAIKSFIALQKRRLETNEINVNIDQNLEQSNAMITPLLLLNYIENAFRHGYNSEAFSEIIVDLKKHENGIYLIVKNTNHSVFENKTGGNHKNKKLLEYNYPNKHQLKTTKNKDFYTLELWINLS